ncbi:MAG: gamma-glutamyl-gamma-aminobutyrate hydrolase family protein [Anaerolineaceae bacterium]|nr:gamma-glutamyl-gamma-aminobutyrate hydrolase family protein [Anaerolineaceae bacterium]
MLQNDRLPVIGITCGRGFDKTLPSEIKLGEAYLAAIRTAGAVPVVIPPGLAEDAYAQLMIGLSGLLLTGGGDIDPVQYGRKDADHTMLIDQDRDRAELWMTRWATDHDLPVLGICRGHQVLNVALGGSLHVDVLQERIDSLKHFYYPDFPRDYYAHPVSLAPDGMLASIFGKDSVGVNSIHHQGVERLGGGLRAVAFAPDGLIEGIQHDQKRFCLGVQWHPECLPEDENMQTLFSAFINAARQGL